MSYFEYPREECPHCGGYLPSNRTDEHIGSAHADIPPCTATLDDEHTNGTLHCVFRAWHRRGEYGEHHVSARGPIGRTVWDDSAQGAQSHREEANR